MILKSSEEAKCSSDKSLNFYFYRFSSSFFSWTVKTSLKGAPILPSTAVLYYSVQTYKIPYNAVQVSLGFFRKDAVHRWTQATINNL